MTSGRIEIMVKILTNCREPVSKIHIMRMNDLSYKQTEEYVNFLKSSYLLECDREKCVATHKGEQFLDAFFRLNEIIETGSEEF